MNGSENNFNNLIFSNFFGNYKCIQSSYTYLLYITIRGKLIFVNLLVANLHQLSVKQYYISSLR